MYYYLFLLLGIMISIICFNITHKLSVLMMKKFHPDKLKVCPLCGKLFFNEDSICCDTCGVVLEKYGDWIVQNGKTKIKVAMVPEEVKLHTRLCFNCGLHFTSKSKNDDILYCPYCGKKTYGFDDESLERFDKDYSDLEDGDTNE